MCSAPFLPASLQVHSVAGVWLGLVILDPILTVQDSFLANAEGSVFKYKCMAPYSMLPLQLWRNSKCIKGSSKTLKVPTSNVVSSQVQNM